MKVLIVVLFVVFVTPAFGDYYNPYAYNYPITHTHKVVVCRDAYYKPIYTWTPRRCTNTYDTRGRLLYTQCTGGYYEWRDKIIPRKCWYEYH